MRDWAAIARTYAQFRDGHSRRDARRSLAVVLDGPVGDDYVVTHAALRALLREDVMQVLAELGVLDERAGAALDRDERALYSLSLIDELHRIARAPHFTPAQRDAIAARAEAMQPPEVVLARIVPRDRHLRRDPAHVPISELVAELLALAGIDAEVDGYPDGLEIIIGKRTSTSPRCDPADAQAVAAIVNALLPPKVTRRLHAVGTADWCVVLATAREAVRLREAGLID